MRTLLALIAAGSPWPLRRWILASLLGHRLGPGSRVGFSVILCGRMELAEGASIGSGTVVKGLAELRLGRRAYLGNFNWISGFPKDNRDHFTQVADRLPALILGDEAAVTHRHLIDCTHTVTIGALSTFAGFRSQILTHSIDLKQSRQDCAPVCIGERCFVGTGCILLPGAVLPERSVLAAGAVLHRSQERPGVYAGVPAKWIQPAEGAYFDRDRGFVA